MFTELHHDKSRAWCCPVVSTTSCTPTGLWRNTLLISWKKTTPNFLFPPCEGEYLSGREDSGFLTSPSAVRGGECNWTASSVMICLQLRARSPELGAHWNTEQGVWSESCNFIRMVLNSPLRSLLSLLAVFTALEGENSAFDWRWTLCWFCGFKSFVILAEADLESLCIQYLGWQ